MDGRSDSSPKAALLGAEGLRRSGGRLVRRFSTNSLRREFVCRLPEKVRSGLDDIESPCEIDLSRTSGVTKEPNFLDLRWNLPEENVPWLNITRIPSCDWSFLLFYFLFYAVGVKEYYEQQFATLKSFEEVDTLAITDSINEEDEEEQAQHERAMKISNYANIALLALKIYATIRSLSIAIAASTLDSLLDLMAGGILWFTHSYMKKVNIYRYPIGKLRVQPVGIIVFAAVMATLGFQIMIQAFEQLIEGTPSEDLSTNQFIWMCSIMIFATIVKLSLWFYCKRSRNKIVRAYANDHYFDVITNVIGLIAAVLGDKICWWIDPVGAILLAVYTMINWSRTVWENAVSLVGQSAPPQFLQKITYLALLHPHIQRIDTVRAYTFGVLYFVEVDIELQEDLLLKEAHTIGETLQIKIEKLPEVERAFIHLDFECEHKPEHSVLLRLPSTQD